MLGYGLRYGLGYLDLGYGLGLGPFIGLGIKDIGIWVRVWFRVEVKYIKYRIRVRGMG